MRAQLLPAVARRQIIVLGNDLNARQDLLLLVSRLPSALHLSY